MIFDTHCHLNSKELYKDHEKYIISAKNAGVASFLVVGYDFESSKRAVELANKYDCVFAAVGYHPTDVIKAKKSDIDATFKLLKSPKVVALGEIGLDYHWVEDQEGRSNQKEWFKKQIEIANKNKLPIIVHNRDASNDCLEILRETKPLYGGVMHCYSGSVELAKEFMKLGLYISLGGPVTFKNARVPKEVAAAIPLDRLLIETDCPYLSPHPLRGTLNEPKNIVYVAKEIALLRNMSEEELIEATYKNALKCFTCKL